MTPEVDGIPINPDLLGRFEVVMDIVYQPLQTRLLREAEAHGCATIDGLQMLIHQGAAQFELFTGQAAPAEVMSRAAYAALGKKIVRGGGKGREPLPPPQNPHPQSLKK